MCSEFLIFTAFKHTSFRIFCFILPENEGFFADIKRIPNRYGTYGDANIACFQSRVIGSDIRQKPPIKSFKSAPSDFSQENALHSRVI